MFVPWMNMHQREIHQSVKCWKTRNFELYSNSNMRSRWNGKKYKLILRVLQRTLAQGSRKITNASTCAISRNWIATSAVNTIRVVAGRIALKTKISQITICQRYNESIYKFWVWFKWRFKGIYLKFILSMTVKEKLALITVVSLPSWRASGKTGSIDMVTWYLIQTASTLF